MAAVEEATEMKWLAGGILVLGIIALLRAYLHSSHLIDRDGEQKRPRRWYGGWGGGSGV